MALGGEVDHGVELFRLKQIENELAVGDAALHELKTRIPKSRGERFQIARVGQRVQTDERNVGIVPQHIMDKVAADEAGAAGDKQFFHG